MRRNVVWPYFGNVYYCVFPLLVDIHYYCNLSIFWRQNVCCVFSVPSVNFCHSSRCFFLLRYTMLIQSYVTFSYLFVSKVQYCLKPPAQTSRYQSSGTCSMKLANRVLAVLLDQSRSSEGARHDRGSQSELGAWLVTWSGRSFPIILRPLTTHIGPGDLWWIVVEWWCVGKFPHSRGDWLAGGRTDTHRRSSSSCFAASVRLSLYCRTYKNLDCTWSKILLANLYDFQPQVNYLSLTHQNLEESRTKTWKTFIVSCKAVKDFGVAWLLVGTVLVGTVLLERRSNPMREWHQHAHLLVPRLPRIPFCCPS